MRKLTVLLTILAIAVITLASGLSPSTTNKAEAVISNSQPQETGDTSDDPPGTIDGAKNPELIPDDVAYSLFFRFLSDRQSEEEKNSMRAYVKQSALNGVNVDALLAVGNEFKKKVAVVDAQAKALRDQNPNQPDERAANAFRKQYKAITMELTASLPARLGAKGAEKVWEHIVGRVKGRVKIIPGPVMPSGAHSIEPN
jgi:acetylornithine deacetylase/succinyl-diaminopimelate desuccinylase-like protein